MDTAKDTMTKTGKLTEVLKITSIPVLVASLCCLTPIILVVFGLGTVTLASSLADTLYGQYKWIFRAAGLLLLAISIFLYLRRKGICTFDEVKKRQNEILNLIIITLIAAVIGYVFWLYVVVEYFGKLLNIWK